MQILAPLASMLLAVSGHVDAPSVNDSRVIEGCFLVAFQRVPIASIEAGMLKSVDVKEGDEVAENQLVAQIDDADVVWAAEVAKHRYQSKKLQTESALATVRLYELAEAVAKAEWDAANAAERRSPDCYTKFELRRRKLTYLQSGIQKQLEESSSDVAVKDMQATEAEYHQATMVVERRKLKAPHSGRVEKVVRYKGDWVTPGDPVVQLTRMDRLRVEGRVSATRFHPGDIDRQRVGVRIALAGNMKGETVIIRGVEIIASNVVEEDGSFRIMIEIDNQKQGQKWLLSPGMGATVVLQDL